MGFNLKDWFDERLADINPFDGGKTAATVRAARNKPAPAQTITVKQAQPQQILNTRQQLPTGNVSVRQARPVNLTFTNPKPQMPTMKQPKPNLFDNVANFTKNVNDATYGTGLDMAKAIADDAVKAYHTVEAPVAGVVGGSMALYDKAFNKGQNYQNLVNATNQQMDEAVNKSFIPQRVASGQASPTEFAKDFTSTGIRLAPYAMGSTSGALTSKLGAKVAANTGNTVAGQVARIGGNAAVSVPVFAGIDAAQQAFNPGAFDPQQSLRAGLTAGASTVAGDVAGLAAKAAFTKAAPVVKSGAKATANAAKDAALRVEQLNPRVKELDLARQNMQRAFDVETNPVRKRQINEGLAQLNRERVQLTQGGYAQIPGKAPQTQSPLDPSGRIIPQQTQAQGLGSSLPVQPKVYPEVGTVGAPQSAAPQREVPFAESIPQNTSQFVRSAKRSRELSGELKSNLSQRVYTPERNQEQLAKSAMLLQTKGVDNAAAEIVEKLNTKTKKVEAQTVSDAIEAGKALDAMGDDISLQKATEIYEKLSEQLTKAGQTIQAASLLNNRTPQGLFYGAIKSFKKAGVEVTPNIQKGLADLIEVVKNTTSDTYEGQLARFNVAKYVSDNIPSKTTDKLVNFWRAGLLTAPTTTGGNLLGNTVSAISRGVSRPISVTADAAMSKFTGKRTMAMPEELAFTKGALEGGAKFKQYLKTGFDERNALSKYDSRELNYGDSPAGKALTTYVNGVYRLMSAADQPFWYAARNSSLSSLAKADGLNKGLKGAALDDHIKQLMANPPVEIMEQATKDAMYSTFQNKTGLGDAALGFKSGLNKIAPGLGDFIVPFTQVPASIATRIFESTPAGTAATLVKEILKVKKGGQFDQKAMAESIGNSAFGTAVLASGYALANSGNLTFGFPEDQKERELWEAQGKQPYSVRLGDKWYSLNYMQPIGTLLAIGGQTSQKVKDGAGFTDAVSTAIATGGQAMMSQSFLKGVSGVLDAIDDPKRYGEKFVENTAGSLLPNFIRSAARSLDPLQRDPTGALQGVQAGIPGLREGLPAKQDMFGQDMAAKDSPANQFLNPLRPSKVIQSDVLNELQRLYDGDQGILPTQARKDAFKDIELSPEDVRGINKEAGTALKQEYAKLISSESYQALGDEDKKKSIKKVNEIVYGALKNKYAVEKGLIDPANVKLDAKQKDYLAGRLSDIVNDEGSYQAKYETALSEYEQNKSKWSPVERVKKEKNLRYLTVQKDFDKDTVGLYGMSEAEVGRLVRSDPNGNKYVENLLKYGDALVAAGLAKYNKFRDKYGNVQISDGSSRTSSSGRKSSGSKTSKAKKGKFDYKLNGFTSSASTDGTTLYDLLKKARMRYS